MSARYWPSWQDELIRERPEVRPSGHEADQEDSIDRAGVEVDDFLSRQAEPRRDCVKVWPVVDDGDSVEPPRFFHRRTFGGEAPDRGRQGVVGDLLGAETHRDARCTHDRLTHVASLLPRTGQPDGPSVDPGVDTRTPLSEQADGRQRMAAA